MNLHDAILNDNFLYVDEDVKTIAKPMAEITTTIIKYSQR